MSIKVQKYLANLGKSVAYTTADVLSEKFTYVNDFKNENQEVFKEVYHSIKDYRTTYARIKKTITDNKIMDAARVGFDSIVYSVTTGDFYAKNKEQEVMNKYGGNFMQGMDIDDDDFDFGNEDVTDGDKVIATAVKKNSKLQTAITTEAIVKTGKAQMDVSKENTMLLYTQNERLINKLDGGLQNITGFLKQNAEQTAKVQNQMNENLNKFMANVDNNVAKLTKQMDELLEMQRNLYAKQTQDQNQKKKIGYDDIIGRGGIINLKEYGKNVGRNASNELMQAIPGLNMLLGDSIEGSNLLAAMLANPTRELSKVAVNKALGKSFDQAAKALNKTLENLVPSLIAKANAAGKKEDAGLAGLLGKILGIKTGSNENVDPNKYVKGAIPFDGITKKAIVDVIPYYLRKMTSAMTGGEEMTFDYTTGRWTSMKSAKKAYDSITTSAQRNTESLIRGTIEAGTNRSFESMYASIGEYDRANAAVQSLALKLQAAGDFSSLRESDLTSAEKVIYTSMKNIFQRSEHYRYERDANGKPIKMRKGFSGPDVSAMDGQLLEILRSQNSAIKQLNEQGGIAMLAAMEGITGDAKSYHGKSYVDAKGDMNERHIQEMPTAQVLLRAKDEYGVTLYQYLRSMGHSLNYIKKYSTYLQTLPFINNGLNPNPPGSGGGGGNPSGTPPTLNMPTSNDGFVDYGNNTKDDKYASKYYEQLETEAKRKAGKSFEDNIKRVEEQARKKGRSVSFITDSYNYQSEGDQIGMSRLVSDYYGEGGQYETEFKLNQQKEDAKKEKEKWKKMEELVGKETTDKLKKATDKYDKDKGLMENLSKATGTTEKLAIAAKWFTQKTNFAVMDKVTGTIVKTDAWLRNLIYGEDLKADDQKKSLWQLMKDHTSDFFKNVQKQIGELFSPVKKYYDEKIKPHVDKVKKKIFGDVDSEGNILEEGVLSHFTAGFRKGMVKNADDVHAMWKKEIEEAKRLGDKITNPESSSSSSDSNPSPSPSPQPEQIIENPRQAKQRRKIDSQIKTIYQLRQKISTQKQYINEVKGYIQDANDNVTSLKYYGVDIDDPQKYLEAVREKQAYESELRNAENELKKLNNALKNAKKKYDSLVAEANAMGMRNIDSLATMAAGGVNRTGHPFQSVLSAGEYLNGSKIGQTGIYTIPKGGVVYNPAPASVRNIQARNEKNFIRGLRYNAEANDGLTPEELAQHQQLDAESKKRIEQVDINKLTDWTTLEDDKQRAAFLGNMASRGALGGVAGLLVGGPLLGAAVGAASTLTKSTGSFASFLFGDVEKDKKTGEIIVDSNGNPKRKDTGLISKELQKAAPDMAKGGMAGMAAGLLTPLGPLGGLLIGTGLGFAKNSEIFQGSLFGEGGIFSDKNVDKLKKGAKNMGIGAATAALFLPGPFGLVGSALIGATAGYVTSTDKFKDFLLGEEDENGKRRGGVRGALNDNLVKPLKGFGQTIIDKTMDEIFGKKNGDGEDAKREGGLFGAIRDNVITPMTSGAQSIFKELTNTIVDIKDFTSDIFKKIKANMAGNNFLGDIFEKAGKIGSGAIGIAGRLGRAATKPFRLLGDEGIGGRLKAKRIRRGRADDMTARQRLAARGKLKMAKTDQWSAIDEYLADGTSGDIESLLNILSYDENSGEIDNFVNSSYDVLGQELRNNLDRKDAKRIIKMLKEGRDKDVERFLNTRNIDDDTKKSVMKELKLHRGKLDKASKDYKDIKDSKMTVQQYLLSKGINVDLNNKKAVRNLKLMANRELAHKGVGLTDEEVAFEAEKAFWKGKDSPLETVNTAAKKMEEMLENIHYDLTIGNGYDKLSKEEQAKYGSKEAYIKSVKDSRAQKAIKENAANGGYVIGKNDKIGSINKDSVKAGDFITNDLWNDYVPMLTGDLKGYLAADTRMANVLNTEINELIDTACQMFDGLALKELCVPERIRDDIQTYKQKIMNKEKCSEEEAIKKIKTMRRKITISRGEAVYTFEMSYTVNDSTVNPNKRQPNSYDAAKRQFIEDYLADHRPKTIEDSYMSFGDMISKSLKLGIYMNPIAMPNLPAFTGIHSLFVKDTIKTHGKSIISGAIKGVKKIGFNVGLALGDHKIDDNSLIQRLNNYQYQQEAEKEWNKEVASYQSALEALRTANTASEEVQNKLKEELADKFEFLDAITKRCNLGVDRFSACTKDEQKQVHDEFVNMYIQAKKENQVFGRGIIGGIKQIGKRIVRSKLGQTIKLIKGTGKILFNDNAEGTKEERMKKVRANLERKAEYAWSKMFVLKKNEKGEEYIEAIPELQQLVRELYGGKNDHSENVGWDGLTDNEKKAIKTIFIERFIAGRYQKLMNSISDNIKIKVHSKLQGVRDKINNGIRTAAAKVVDFANDTKEKIKKKASDVKRNKVISLAIKNKDERLDELALELYGKKYNELDAKEQNKVNDRFYARYGYGKASLTETFMRGAIKKVVGSDRYKSVTGTLKSGIRNATAGKLDAVRAWKEKNQEQDTLIGKFFDRMDARQLRKDKENFEGKKDSKIGKIIKWLFIGGMFVPLVVGFIKQDVLPAIREKIKPWLVKAKDKIFGVKNETTGEYEGGIISGIVNPIRKFFKSKFEKVHNWIHNEGEYNTDDKGLKGFWNGLAKVGAHIVDLWKIGFTTVYGETVPKILYAVGHNLIPLIVNTVKNVGLGLIDSIKDIAAGRQGILDISIPSAEGVDVKSEASTVEVPSTVGGKVQLTSPAYSSNVNFPSEVTNKNGSKISASRNENGTINYTNEFTGKQVTSKSDGDYYYIGTNQNGVPLYKDNKSNKVYTTGNNGDYIPISEYNELVNESLSDNIEYQRQKELEDANAFNADYTGQSDEKKIANISTRLLARAGNMVVLNGADGVKAMTGATRLIGAPFKAVKPFGIPGKVVGTLGNGVTKAGEKMITPAAVVQSKALNAVGKAGDKVTKNSFSKIGQRVADKQALKAARAASKDLEAATKATKAVARNNRKLAAASAKSSDNFIGKAINFIEKSVLKIKGKILEILKDEKVAKVTGKALKDNADEIADKVANGTVKTIKESTKEITEKGGSIAAKGAAKVLSVVMIVADFLIGMDNCRNLLGIVAPKPSIVERITGGLINIIPDVIMTLAEVVTGASFGAAAVVGAILAGLSIVSTIVISIDNIRDKLVGMIIDVLDNIPGIDMSSIKEERTNAKSAIEAYNAKNNTNLNIEEYNNIIGNKTVTSKIGDSAKNTWSAMFGYDSASKNTILNKTENLESKGNSDKVRKKLSTIFSSIWQNFGEKDFNPAQYDENGNELQNKERINANKFKFNEISTQVISNLNALLVQEDEKVINDVLSNTSKFTGPWDSTHYLKTVYNSGRENPLTQFNVDEEHSHWQQIRAMAGICAIINEIFEPCGKKAEVTKAVLDVALPAYFTSNQISNMEIEELDNSMYTVDMSKYDEKATTDAATSYEGIDKYGNKIATNANANDKLSSYDPLMKGLEKGFSWIKDTNPLEKFGIYLGNIINDSIKGFTGGFEGIEQFFSNMASKNASVNRRINTLSILPTDKNYWKVELDNKNPFMSGLFNFVESINRTIKAPFALTAASLTASMSSLQSSNSSNNSTGTTTIINNSSSNSSSTSSSTGAVSTSGTTTTASSTGGLWQGIKNTASKLWNGFKSLFGKGKDEDDKSGYGSTSDPYHIYQRAYSGSYRTAGDTESQTIADSGCGPASAASVLRMYGKKGDMRNAVNYALNNKYKEVNGGTYPEYFKSYLNKNGIRTNSNANNADVVNNLAHGNPVILMGRDSQNSGKTPYGSKYSHYVVARGLDRNGNVIVEDSEDKRGSTHYSLADTLKNSTVRITTGRGKYGRGNESLANRYISGVSGFTSAYIANLIANIISSLSNVKVVNNAATTQTTPTTSNTTTTFANTKYELTEEQLKKLAYVCEREQGEGEMGVKFEASLMCNLFEYKNSIQNNKWKDVCDYVLHSGWFASRSTGSSSNNQQVIEWVRDVICNGNRVCPQCIVEHDWINDLTKLYGPGSLSDKSSFVSNETEFDNKYGGHWIFWGYPGGDTTRDPFGYTEASLKWAGGQVPPPQTNGTATTGKGRYGRAVDVANFANSGEIERQENLNKLGMTDPFKAPEKEQTPQEKFKELTKTTITGSEDVDKIIANNNKTTTPTITTNNNTNASGLIPTVQKYTGGLLQGIFGNFYDALYGAESDSGTITTAASNNGATAAYNGNDVVYAAAMVFEALGKVHPEGTYKGGFFDITCRDGTKIDHVRCDCSGLMTAIIQYMGYYTYKSSQSEYTDSYHGEGLSSSMSLSDIYDKDGNPVTDWEEISKSNCTGSNAKPGDIRFESGHTDMFVCYKNGSEWPKGFNAGSTKGILASYKAAEAFFNNNNSFPMDGSIGASTIRDATCIKAFRFKGRSASGRGKKADKVDLARLNRRIRPKNYILDEQGNRMYLSELLRKKYSSLSKFGKGKFGRAEEDNTTPDETTFIGPQLPADKATPENNPGVSESDVDAVTNNDKLSTTTNTSTTSGKEPKATSLISLLKKYIGLSTNSVTGQDDTNNTVVAGANVMGAASGGGTKDNPVTGIDISYCDSENIDWDTLSKNITFAIIRIGSSYRSKTDSKIMTDTLFERHYKNATEHGVAVGGYFYSYASSAAEAAQEADMCLEIIKGKTFQLPIYIDIEEKSSCLRAKVAGEIAQAFMDKMIAAGYATGIYCSASAFNKTYFNSEPGSGVLDNSKYSIWVANYTSRTNESFHGLKDYDIWQYSSSITPPGKNRNTDMDKCYSSFADMANKKGIGGTGRGKALVDKIMKSGKGKWGRAEEDNTTPDETTFIGPQLPADKVTPENTSGVSESDVTTTEDTTTTETTPTITTVPATTTTSTPGQKPASTLISKLSRYAKAVTKGVFGNFYDALYGAEQEQAVVNNNETVGVSGTSGTLQNAIPYSTYAIWKQGWASRDGEPHWINKGWNTKTAISIGGQNIGEAGCSLCSTALMLVHSGVVQEADFDPGKFADDINTRSECSGGCGYDAPMRHMCEYKGNTTMQYVDTYTNSFVGKSFDELFDFVLKSMQEGYFLIGHVTNHFCCIDYIDTANRVIYILDPGFRANCWYDGKNKPSCLDSTDIGYTMSNGPSGKVIHGVLRYRSSTTNPSCYILNGRRSFDSLHETGNAPNATIGGTTISTTTTPASTAQDSAAFAAANTSEDGTGRGKYGRGNAATSYVGGPETRPGIVGDYDGTYARRMKITSDKTSTGVLKSYDSISRNHTNSGRGNVYNNSNSPSVHVSNTGRGSIMDAIDNTYAQYGGDNLASILRLAAIIADNSNKIDDILAVLATIAVNTENTTTAIGNSNNKKIPNGSKNGLSALRTALNDNNSGEDIINAIYQIAKS